MNTRTDNKGFTIIEVVLVLAIAALIFLMVFVALPALQRGQANTARKNDASTVASAVNTYRTNNNGRLPTTYAQIANYIDELGQLDIPPTGNLLTGAGSLAVADDTNLDTVVIRTQAKCGENGEAVDGTSKQAAVITVLETSAGEFTAFCTNA